MRIPIGIEDDHCIGCLQIQTQTTGTCREKKDEIIRLVFTEFSEQIATFLRLRLTVET